MSKQWTGMRVAMALGLFLAGCSTTLGTEVTGGTWKLETTSGPLPRVDFVAAPNGLPDGGVAMAEGESDVAAAWYTKPTKRYAHAILGDDIEAGALTVSLPDGRRATYTLPDHQVFEDRTPRLRDLGLNGKTNIITILSDAQGGGSIAVFGIEDGELRMLAQTPYIGRTNRWRNIAGIADFDGDGSLQIAEVITPHIGGTLQFWTWKQGKLIDSGSMSGFSNHFIGSRDQDLSVVEDFDGDGVDDLMLPDAGRTSLRVVGFSGRANGTKTLEERARIALPARLTTNMFGKRDGERITVRFGLEDGSFRTLQN